MDGGKLKKIFNSYIFLTVLTYFCAFCVLFDVVRTGGLTEIRVCTWMCVGKHVRIRFNTCVRYSLKLREKNLQTITLKRTTAKRKINVPPRKKHIVFDAKRFQ